jgi:uncharacterized membrane protein
MINLILRVLYVAYLWAADYEKYKEMPIEERKQYKKITLKAILYFLAFLVLFIFMLLSPSFMIIGIILILIFIIIKIMNRD